ncbi:hypothetical protein MW887_009882 [Aspergillus wentii]|nr:hypothetical protein MW887_009882 [Aspergillus wentii]
MVFPGKRSTGCFVCRRRKVKCDGAKPHCQHCTSRGVECTGYPDAFQFRPYKSENPSPPQSALITQQRDQPPVVRCRSPRLRSGPALSLEWQSGDDPCLRHAILSVTYLALYNTARVDVLHLQARKHYGSAIHHLVEALKSTETAVQDEVFAASLFLSMFTDLSNEDGDSLNPHIPGAYGLMQVRDRLQLSTKYGRELFGWAVTQVQTQAIAHHEFRYAALPQSIRMMYQPDIIYRAGIVTGMISDLCRSMGEIRNILNHGPINQNGKDSVSRLLEQAHYFIDEIDTWHEAIPGHWKRQYQPTETEAIPAQRDQWTTCYLATIYSAQIIFYMQISEFCQHLNTLGISLGQLYIDDDPIEPFLDLGTRISNLIEMICSTVASTLGTITAYRKFQPSPDTKLANGYILRGPMRVVVSCRFSTPEQVFLCQQGLHFAGRSMSIGQIA